MLIKFTEKFEKSAKLHLLYSYILQMQLGNKYKALFELYKVDKSKPTLLEQFSSFHFKQVIESEMVEEGRKSLEATGMDVLNIVMSQNKFTQFQRDVDLAVNLHVDFWHELMEEAPETSKMQRLGRNITARIESCQLFFDQLMDLNPNHLRALVIYGNFLKDVVSQEKKGQKMLEKANFIGKSSLVNKHISEDKRFKYGENAKTAILTISGNPETLGIVVNSNEEIFKVLGFQKKEIIGEYIEKVMPQVYGQMHAGFMMRFIETGESHIMNEERVVFPIHKKKYMTPCTLVLKVLPLLDNGLHFVGFLRDYIEDLRLVKGTGEGTGEKSLSYHLIYMAPKEMEVYPEKEAGEKEESLEDLKKVLDVEYGTKEMDNAVGVSMTETEDEFFVVGVSKDICQSFGIRPSFLHGNNKNYKYLSMRTICPELAELDKIQQAAGLTGVKVTFDTTKLSEIFYEDMDEDEGLSNDSGDENDESSDSPGSESSKASANLRESNFGNKEDTSIPNLVGVLAPSKSSLNEEDFGYKSATLRAFIEHREVYKYNGKFVCILHVRLSEFTNKEANMGMENMPMASFNTQVSRNSFRSRTTFQDQVPMEENNEEEQQRVDMSVEGIGDASSNYSANSENNDLRNIRDIQSVISEKNIPQNIKYLQKAILLVFLVLIGITSSDFIVKYFREQYYTDSYDSLFYSSKRTSHLAEINFFIRKAYLFGLGRLENERAEELSDQEFMEYLLEKVSSLSVELQSIHFESLKDKIIMRKADGTIDDPKPEYPLKYLLSNLEEMKIQTTFTDSIYTYINNINLLLNSSTSIWAEGDYSKAFKTEDNRATPIEKYFYFIIENGLGILREVSYQNFRDFYAFYNDKLFKYQLVSGVVVGLSIILTVISLVFLIPIVFSVYKTNQIAMTLFGRISPDELELLSSACDQFMETFLQSKKEFSAFEEEVQEEKEILKEDPKKNEGGANQKIIEEESEEEESSSRKEASKGEKVEENEEQKEGEVQDDAQLLEEEKKTKEKEKKELKKPFLTKEQKKTMKNDEVEKESQEEDWQENRIKKLLNSKSYDRQRIFIQFSIAGFFIISFFAFSFVWDFLFIQNVKNTMDHFEYISQRPIFMRFTVTFTYEELARLEAFTFSGCSSSFFGS